LHRLLTVVLIVTFVFLLGPSLEAQVYSYDDTLSTTETEGFRGDTVTVLFDLVNTFAVGGFQIRVTYDTATFIPIAMSLTPRSALFDVFGSNFGDPGIATFYATSMRPLDNPISPGSGPIAAFDLAVLDSAIPGVYFIRFEDSDSISHENGLSNAMGDSLIIPIFVERPVSVLPVESADDAVGLPVTFGMAQNYPNPSNGETIISFSLKSSSWVQLSIVDLLGRVVAVPFSGEASAGKSVVTWNGQGANGHDVSSGIYFYRLINSGGESVTQKLTLLK